MSTDLLTTAAVGATTTEADAMPYRLINLFPHPVLSLWGGIASAGSVLAVVNQDNVVAVAMAVVAVGTVLAQPLMRFYKGLREAKLEADTKEHDIWESKDQSTGTKLGIALGRLEAAEERIDELKARLAKYEGQVVAVKQDLVDVKGKQNAVITAANNATRAVNELKPRVEAVEVVQTSLSGDNFPATPVPPEPKAG